MKRFIWGIVLIVFGILAFMGAEGADKDEAVLGGFIFVIVGTILTYYGHKYKNGLKQTSEFALQMIRDDEKIDARELAQRVGVSEVDIRAYIAEAQKKGTIPFKADII